MVDRKELPGWFLGCFLQRLAIPGGITNEENKAAGAMGGRPVVIRISFDRLEEAILEHITPRKGAEG